MTDDVYAPPAFQFYARDWITNTAQLTAEEKGALADLKAYAWLAVMRSEPPCSLPDDDAKLARLSGLGARWRKMAATIRSYFRVEGDRLIDDELLRHRVEREQYHNERSESGRRGAEKRHGKANPAGTGSATGLASGSASSNGMAQPVAEHVANAWQNSSKNLALQSASASASASKSGAEADVSSRPAVADAVSGSNGAAPPAPPADAGAAEDQPRRAPPNLPSSALVLLYRMPDAKQHDGEAQLHGSLTPAGARLVKGDYVRAASVAHLEWACKAVLESPPDKPEQLARWVLLKLRDTFTEWRSRDEKHAEQRTAPIVAKLLRSAEPIDDLGEAHRWVHEQPDLKAEIEAAAEKRFEGWPKNAKMLRDHAQWIDEQCLARWKDAGAPTLTTGGKP